MANPMYGQNKFDEQLGDAKYLENKIALNSWNFGHLAMQLAADTTEAKSRSGITLIDGQIAESLGIGDTGAAATTLPAAKYGGLCVYRHSGVFGGGQSHVISCASGETFKGGSMNFQAEAQEVLHLMTPVYLSSYTPTVAIAGGTIVAVADADNTLTYAGTATNNQTNIGAEWAFFCEKDGEWTPAFRGCELGTGAVNASLAFSTV
tara:strand:- start:1590 stop:2207 length:618 start_codon:yes stop_codon:yes gene_type:complete